MEIIRLSCWTCRSTFGARRRHHNDYPDRCPRCTETEQRAVQLRARATEFGLTATIDRTTTGYVCLITTPWHTAPVIVRDQLDLTWLLVELDTNTHEKAAA